MPSYIQRWGVLLLLYVHNAVVPAVASPPFVVQTLTGGALPLARLTVNGPVTGWGAARVIKPLQNGELIDEQFPEGFMDPQLGGGSMLDASTSTSPLARHVPDWSS